MYKGRQKKPQPDKTKRDEAKASSKKNLSQNKTERLNTRKLAGLLVTEEQSCSGTEGRSTDTRYTRRGEQ